MSTNTRSTSTEIESETSEYSPMDKLQCNESMPNRKHCLHDLLNQIIDKLNRIDERLAFVQYHTQTIKVKRQGEDDPEIADGDDAV